MAFTGFGTSTTSAPSTGFSFGGGATSTSSGLGTGGLFGTSTSKPATGIGFGTGTSTSTGLGGGGLFGTTTTKATTGLSFGTAAAAAKPGGLTFGTSTTTSVGFGQKTTSAGLSLGTTSLNFGTSSTANSTFKGLGGVDPSVTTSATNGNGNKTDTISQAVKDQTIPDEICKDVKSFEDYVAKQKEESNAVGKFSVQSLHKINDEINSLSSALALIATAVQRNKSVVEKLRDEFVAQLGHAEMARRTQDIPPTLQHDNVAPLKYFVDLVMEFGVNMQTYRLQIEELENHLQSLAQPSSLTAHDISIAMCKMQEGFVSLAANLHSIHNNVKHIKEQYLAYRQIVHGDNTDIFAANRSKTESRSPPAHGPSPLSNMSNVAALAMATMLQQPQQAQQAPPAQSFLKPSFGAGSSSLFNTKTTAASGGLFGGALTKSASTGFASTGTLRPALSAGFAKSTSGNVFFGNTSFNSSAGVTFGGSALNQGGFDLKPPPTTNKRNRK